MIAPAYIVKMFSNPGMRPIPIGVRRVSRRFDIFRSAARPRAALGVRQFIAALLYFGLRHVPVPLSNILDCGNSLPLSFRTTSRVAFVYFRMRRVPRTVFDFITLSHHFGSAVRLNAVKQVPL